MMLRQDEHGILHGLQGLQHVLLIRVELCRFLLANRGCFLQGFLVRSLLLLRLRDLGLQLRSLRRQAFDVREQAVDLLVRIARRGGLVLLIRFAPTDELVVHRPERPLSAKATPTGEWYQNETCMHTFSVEFFTNFLIFPEVSEHLTKIINLILAFFVELRGNYIKIVAKIYQHLP